MSQWNINDGKKLKGKEEEVYKRKTGEKQT